MPDSSLYLGDVIDPATGERLDQPLRYHPADLTTHAVIVGMTGSGKTGLGVAMIEEAMLEGIPCLVIDPKGDMTNLALTFPELAPADFRPWIDESEAARTDTDTDALAAETAHTWRRGLQGWGLDGDAITALRDSSPVTIYTPGSSAGTPINIVGSLRAPDIGWEGNEEVLRDEIEGFVSSLLTLAGIDADPVSAPEHILLATIIEHAWSRDHDLDLAELIGSVVEPPVRKLGVFDVDVFFPRRSRTDLAMTLNGLVASPSFAAWLEGPPLDIATLLGVGDRARTAVVYLAHLSETERQFVVTLLLSKVVTWMRQQQGTGTLRSMVYMDEVFGYAPPTAEPPSKKPLLTLLKQARAYGVGLVLSTQNPVDLDYKAMSNAGTWMIGRLQTERDKSRILEGMASATGKVEMSTMSRLISGLDKRQFVLHSVRQAEPVVFTTRWVMSYLAGPLTRNQLSGLGAAPPTQPEAKPAQAPEIGDDTTTVAPPVAHDVPVRWVAHAAPWLSTIGGHPGSEVYAAAAVATVHLRYDDHHADVDHTELYEVVVFPLHKPRTHSVDHDDRDFLPTPPGPARYRLPDVDLSSPRLWKDIETRLVDDLLAGRTLTVFKNADLGVYSRVGETREAFDQRCKRLAEERADVEVAALTEKYETRIRTATEAIRRAEHRVRELEADVEARKQAELLSGAGDLLGAILGGRRGSSGLRRAASHRAQTRRTEERLATADARRATQQEDLATLEADLAHDVTEITARWARATEGTVEVHVGLERSDVRVESLMAAWTPAST